MLTVRTIQRAMRALIAEAAPNATLVGFDGTTSQTIRAGGGGTIVGRPPEGELEPEVDLSPVTYHYDYPMQIEVLAPPIDSDASVEWLDGIVGAIGVQVRENRTLGGLCSYLSVTLPIISDATPEGSGTKQLATFDLTASFSTADPLN